MIKYRFFGMPAKKSKKGFLAIDIDGTALVQKIDKNPTYGLLNSQSNMRLALIRYILQADKQGFDIIILTSRPQQIEAALGTLNIGTKPTQSIVDNLMEYGIQVKEIERAPAGLKGGKMKQILDEYPPGAVGMLFDDQLKQVNDVKKQNNVNLIAYDINSKLDLDDYSKRVNLPLEDPFHPMQIVPRVLLDNEKLRMLQASCHQLANNFPQEMKLTQNVVNELCIRSFEADYRDYQPEIDWINTTAKHVQFFVDTLNYSEGLSIEEVENATKEIFGTKKLDRVVPNSNCDVFVKHFLEECARNALIRQLRIQCEHFMEETNHNKGDDTELHQQQEDVVNALITELKNPDKKKAIDQFARKFQKSKDLIQKYPNSEGFIESIRTLLAKAPFIGSLFQTAKEKIAEKMEGNVTSAHKNRLTEEKNHSRSDVEFNSNQTAGPVI